MAGHADANGGALLRVSTVTVDRGGTFRLQSSCPEPSRSARLSSGLFASPALLPARLSKQVTWTVTVSPHQHPGSYSISLNCFQLLTGRVTAAAEIRVEVLGSLLRAVSRAPHQVTRHSVLTTARGRREPPGNGARRR